VSPAILGIAFISLFLVELPDKTFLATLVLSTKYRPLLVWIGVGLAFAVQTGIAVAFGGVISLLPAAVVHTVAGLMFVAGAVLLFREGMSSRSEVDEEAEEEAEFAEKARPAVGARQILASFLVIFAAEWGDLSQLLTVSMVAKYKHPVSIFVGGWAALLIVSGLAAVAGRSLLRYIKLHILHFLGATVCAVLGVYTLVEVLT